MASQCSQAHLSMRLTGDQDELELVNLVFDVLARLLRQHALSPHPTLTAVGVTWLYGFQFEIKVIAKLPETLEWE